MNRIMISFTHLLAFFSVGASALTAFKATSPQYSSRANGFEMARIGVAPKTLTLFATQQNPIADESNAVPTLGNKKVPSAHNQFNISRRRWISTIASASISGGVMFISQTASAAPPLTAEVADNVSARAARALRSKPPKVLRPRMNLDFAVLLMRSSYNAVDDIDIVPMDQFQRDFFLIRQAEYQTYANSLGAGAMTQGDLADPNYFDFISFAQYATISREIINPPVVFEEQQPVEVGEGEPQQFVTTVVKRDPSLTNSNLPMKHTEIVGNTILDKLIETFGDTASAIPKIEPGSRPAASNILAAVKQMVNLFVVSGFAWDGTAAIVKDGPSGNDATGTQLSITFTSPATLWSGQSLKSQKAVLTNDFALKTVKTLMSRAGYNVVDASVKYVNNQEISTFTIV